MKIVQINTCDYGSTGKIMLQIAQTANDAGHEVRTYSRKWFDSKEYGTHKPFGYKWENALHNIIAKTFGCEGSGSYFGTKKLLRELKKFEPDVLHLHNLHGWYINYRLLFKFIKKHNIKTYWTLHDCWSFTGHCPYFDLSGCSKWQTGCEKCPSFREYPQSKTDNSKFMFKRKKKYFLGVQDMTLITPSEWLAGLVKQSFLKEYSVKVVNNGIDTDIFKPTPGDFRQKYGCEDSYVVLGVAFGWGRRKGLDVFAELSKRLPEQYRIVLVGTDDNIDKNLPQNIISIHRTKNQQELAQIYSVADVLVNPTREDNYPTVNMEAIACGAPVITFRTGGSPEMIGERCGEIVACDDIDAMEQEIIRICTQKPYSKTDCISYARSFDQKLRFAEYVMLYGANK
ncbi:MAG: glycosyltransferase [Ruminococcaceae bacterium]|nr:glycosyltransferase [Oscillospiraceae bacterium]